jgi:hypothetical protein
MIYSTLSPPTSPQFQGILSECLQLSDLPAYTTGGTVHFVTGMDKWVYEVYYGSIMEIHHGYIYIIYIYMYAYGILMFFTLNKMKPTNPNAHTYVNGTDVNTHGYAVTHNTFLQ